MITDNNYPEFKRLYLLARDTDAVTFTFNNQLVLTSYAGYVVQYVEQGGNYGDGERDSE